MQKQENCRQRLQAPHILSNFKKRPDAQFAPDRIATDSSSALPSQSDARAGDGKLPTCRL
jgi:hypothetical protein